MIKKVVILGPESSGKSTLCGQLAAHFKTSWVKEYAREYLMTNGSNYTFDALLDIAKGQLKLEDKAIELAQTSMVSSTFIQNKNTLPIFIDTDMYVLKVWCEFVFDQCHQWILNQIVERKYDLYLLCDIDLPWVKDELREYPDLESRKKLYHHYKDILINQNVPWVNISGLHEERLQKAIDAVNQLTV
jgi:NadR type nicotinamide-nucleotide adenylyltransferase